MRGGRYDPATDTWTPTSTLNAPAGRYAHAAVWTGDEMIVWGGDNGDYLNTGGRYDPTADTWSPTSTLNAPAERYYPTAVWTGSEMIVWGGSDSNAYFNSGGRYDPATDTWSPTSMSLAPPGRYVHTAVWTGSRMIVWGGYGKENSTETHLSSGDTYEPVADTWSPTTATDAPAGRSQHTAVWTGTGMIVWGGWRGGGAFLNSGGLYEGTEAADSDGDGTGDLCDSCPLDPLNDADGDGACGDTDACGDSDLSPMLVIAGCDTGVPNTLQGTGCTLQDLVDRCGAGAANHGGFARCLAHLVHDLRERGLLTGREQGRILRCAT